MVVTLKPSLVTDFFVGVVPVLEVPFFVALAGEIVVLLTVSGTAVLATLVWFSMVIVLSASEGAILFFVVLRSVSRVFSFEEISKNKTKITAECCRYLGAFDTSGEVTEATLFMEIIFDAVSLLLSKKTIEEAIEKVLLEKKEKQDKWIADTTPSDGDIKTFNVIIWIIAAALIVGVLTNI